MTRIRISGYRKGLRKIEMTKAIREHAGLRLDEAKSCTDSVLNGEIVGVQANEQDAAILITKLTAFRAIAKME